MNDPAPPVNDRDVIRSLERGFAVLLAFDAELPHPSLTEVAQRTGLSRPAVRRILLTLQRLGYVAGRDGRWELTPRVLSIGQHYAATHGMVEIAQPHLLDVVEQTGESASLAQLDGTDVVYVARVHARRVLSVNVDVGTRLPAHATSMGRVLIAHAESGALDRMLAAGMAALTPRTITDPERLRAEILRASRRGYAVVDGELEPGFLSAAVPVRDGAGTVVAALAYSTSRARHSPRQVVREVVPVLAAVADDIGRDLALVQGRAGSAARGPAPGGPRSG